MNRNLAPFAILIAAAMVPVIGQAQNLLVNGDLGLPPIGDVAPTGWTLNESPVPDRDPATLIDFADHTTPGPDNRGIWFKPFEGDFPGFPDVIFVDADLIQAVPGIPGQIYQMSGWARFEAGYAGGVDTIATGTGTTREGMPSLTDTFFSLEFLGAGNVVLPGSVSVELRADGQTNNNQWLQHTLMGTAPAGTLSVRVRASMVDGEFNKDIDTGQSAFVDDFVLQVVPEPCTLLLVLPGVAGIVSTSRRRRS
jgi:hypothetical protein